MTRKIWLLLLLFVLLNVAGAFALEWGGARIEGFRAYAGWCASILFYSWASAVVGRFFEARAKG